MGVSEDKPIGSWLGPNTVAQVIRKLATFDGWTNLAVHVTNEDGVIVEEIKNFCQRPSNRRACRFQSTSSDRPAADSPKGSPEIYSTPPPSPPQASSRSTGSASPNPFVFMPPYSSSDFADFSLVNAESMQPDRICAVSMPVSKDVDNDCVEILFPPVVTLDLSNDQTTKHEDNPTQISKEAVSSSLDAQPKGTGDSSRRTSSSSASISSMLAEAGSSPNVSLGSFLSKFDTLEPFWRPLLLIVPLRIGLHDLNLSYIEALKGLFRLPQCVGILGGRPNHALWLIGYVGDNVLCLDPHTTQPAVHLGCPSPSLFASEANLDSATLDGSFHCETPVRMPFQRLDPSLAVGFVCRTEADFDQLCAALRREVLVASSPASSSSLSLPVLFEIHERRPHNMPPPFSASFKLTDGWTDISAGGGAPTQKDDEFEII